MFFLSLTNMPEQRIQSASQKQFNKLIQEVNMLNTSHFHPMTIHFPIAIIMLGFLFDFLSMFFNKKEPCLSKAGFWLMILGTIAAVAGYLTGEFFSETLSGQAGDLKETHEIFAKTTMFIMIAASALRIFLVYKKKETTGLKWIVFGLFFIAVVCVGITGLLGGNLVYNYMIGLQFFQKKFLKQKKSLSLHSQN
eukprot:TRINITY_DN2533_c0_g1_i1.p1 TRINITY_DN2533_c0_g1~~TRINITY_DN2533_c0_g1_i1.p1  ORF type:complete len:194 (-),score=13.81 TRINITY_DN2533_c0_g1_i1:93-674(-)